AGFKDAQIRPFANRYPLHYWIRLAPIPQSLKRPLHARLRRGGADGMGGWMLRASVGNMSAWAST
ncbi:MAG: hypothetical protein ACLPSY_08885, partial [Steroidobacteraceae bacterium]